MRIVLGIGLLLTAPLRAQPSAEYCPRQLPAPLPTVADCGETCGGVDRWSVKTLTDRDVDAIDWTPRPTTIAALGALRRVATRPQDRRASVHERRVYCVEGLLEIQDPRPQDDGDLHVVLTDPNDMRRSMVVEIPDPKCRNVCGSPWVSVFANARADLEGRLQRETRDTIRVVVTGVGFFDRNHGQVGAAPNYFELHPVLSVRFPKPARARRP